MQKIFFAMKIFSLKHEKIFSLKLNNPGWKAKMRQIEQECEYKRADNANLIVDGMQKTPFTKTIIFCEMKT